MQNPIERFNAALQPPSPTMQLREVAVQLLQEGFSRAESLKMLEDYRNQLQTEQRYADEDVVLEVMDFVVGWCSPHVRV
jgi:hypothetical protein